MHYTTDAYLFTLNAVDLFFYKKNIGQVEIKSYFTDGSNDGGIDYIFPSQDDDTIYFIQGKSTHSLTLDDAKNIFNKINETITNFETKKYDKYSKCLISAYWNAMDSLSDNCNIALVLFTNTQLTEEMRKQIEVFSNSETMSPYLIYVYDEKDIQLRAANLYQGSDLIQEDSIELYLNDDKKNNILAYGDNGIIVNIKAASLKKLYDKYENKGLFSYNLREHITQKNVDDAIERTIRTENKHFWFYNNGITIGCNDFSIDGNKIKLYLFSIINGAQTTTKIGKSKFINDSNNFAIVCKIVKANGIINNDDEFISKISEASNSQKPIRPRDLKSNAKEQKLLAAGAANNKYPLAIEIKRGVKAKNYSSVEKWQRVTNEYVGQLIYACVLQKPGPARSNKKALFNSNKIYRLIFSRELDYDTLYDLVRIATVYDEFATNYVEKTEDIDEIAIVKNGKFTTLGVLIYLLKKHRGLLNDYTSNHLNEYNISGLLITDYPKDDLNKKLEYLFTFIVRELHHIYDTKKQALKLTSISNFFKAETTYDVILNHFDNLDDYDKEKIKEFMTVFDS